MSRTSKYYTPKTIIHRQTHCLWCGGALEHRRTGRPRRFCSGGCRAAHNRAMKQHAAACVDAVLAGQPQPVRDYGQPVSIGRYTMDAEGNVAKRERPL